LKLICNDSCIILSRSEAKNKNKNHCYSKASIFWNTFNWEWDKRCFEADL